MTNPNNIFSTETVNLEKLNDYLFSIPTYQRPYVWGDEQLKKLLTDFYTTFKKNPNEPYYLSTFLTKDYENNGKISELIDGQQRFTTLWLIAFVIFKHSPESFIINFIKKDKNLRLDFEIREEVTQYLNDLSNNDSYNENEFNKHNIENMPYLRNISKALESIEGFLKDIVGDNKMEIEKFGNYIYTQVLFIKNTTPEHTDLNKLFSTINNSGVQLEQTDIVKANLLKLIDNKVLFSKIWESCENMNSFFEGNVNLSFSNNEFKSTNLTRFNEIDETLTKFEDNKYDKHNSDTDKSSESNESKFTIDSIKVEQINGYESKKRESQNESNRDSGDIYCRSIINFGQLLLHTYRLHLKIEKLPDFKGTFHINRLIEIFKEMEKRNNPEEIKKFFKLLWRVRFLFDKYIIKWVTDPNTKEENLDLVNMNKNSEGSYTRSRFEKSNSLMLQSVLYFTGDYLRQYWISSYLAYLLYNHNNLSGKDDAHLQYLEKIDNTFSLTNSINDKELSWQMMQQENSFSLDVDIDCYLKESNSTGFKHYWFYKLEYILWKNWQNRHVDEFKNYRITSKNSVEHIYPQHPDNRNQHPEIDNKYLHSFGNLVLLSVSRNSEYSNKSVGVKQKMFEEKGKSYDTLKSYFIFKKYENYNKWSEKEIIEHRDEMIEFLKSHYNK